MDAVEFVKQLRRMDKHEYSRRCFIYNYLDSPEDVVAEVEQWAKENPVKTRQSEFLKQRPETAIDEKGNVCICPANDVALVVHGRWLDGRCTVCGWEEPDEIGYDGYEFSPWEHTNYCPNCGAKMDGGESNEAD